MEKKTIHLAGKGAAGLRSRSSAAVVCIAGILAAALLLASCANSAAPSTAPSAAPARSETIELQILATSDMHGKFLPYEYALDEDSPAGSLTKVKTAVDQLRTETTIVLDAGDIIQDNSADLFVNDELHPMIAAMNAIGYDVWVTGNHEYNYGTQVLEKIIAQNKAPLLCGNVYDLDGKQLGEDYLILEKGGVKIGVIGMVTPNILKWDSSNLKGWTVTDPVEETKEVIAEIRSQVDVLIAVEHMTLDNEYEVPHSGVTDLANECPELDLIVAAHGHQPIEDMVINGVHVIENKNAAETIGQAVLQLQKDGDTWQIKNISTKLLKTADYEADPALTEKLLPYHEKAVTDAETVIGEMKDEFLAEPNEIPQIPTALIQDTALIDLINEVQLYYSGARVSAASLGIEDANLFKGDIRKCDVSRVYKYSNTLYTLEMNGAQLKKWMEWSVSFFNTFREGDLTISFDPGIRMYNYYMFAGINYEVNIANEPGSRIENLTWADGSEIRDDEVFMVAANNYSASSNLLCYGSVFQQGEELPKVIEIDVCGNIGNIRALIADYIINIKQGTLEGSCDNSWKLTGYHWDEELHAKAVEQLNQGLLTIPSSDDGRTPNVRPVTKDDLK